MRIAQLTTFVMGSAWRNLTFLKLTTDENGNLAPWYHTHDDVPDRIDPQALTRVTDFVVALSRLIDREASRTIGSGAASPTATAERV